MMTLRKIVSSTDMCCCLNFDKTILVNQLNFPLLMAPDFCVHRLHTEDQDHRCGLQCLQQRAGQNQDPGEELHRARRQPSLQAVV